MNFNIFNREDIRDGINYIKENGITKTLSKLAGDGKGRIKGYNSWYEKRKSKYEEKFSKEDLYENEEKYCYKPEISIIIAICPEGNQYVEESVKSVLDQNYHNWELILIDELGKTREIIMPLARGDSRVKYVPVEICMGNAQCINVGISLAKGEYVGILCPGDTIAGWALHLYVKQLQENNYDILYGDEDTFYEDGHKYKTPVFKPEYSQELIDSYNYIGHFPLVKSNIVRHVAGYHKEFGPGADYDYILRCVENCQNGIKHIPEILYHKRMDKTDDISKSDTSYKREIIECNRYALESHIKRMCIYGRVSGDNRGDFNTIIYETPGNPLVSVVISSVADTDKLKKLALAFYEGVRYSNFEIIVVECNTKDKKRIAFLQRMEEQRKNFRVVFIETPGDILKMRNTGAGACKGEYILFLDSNIQIRSPYALGYMLGMCMQDRVGIVGGTLITPDNYIWEKGQALGLNGICASLSRGNMEDVPGYMNHNWVNTNHEVVGNSCIMVKRALYNIIGGYSCNFTTYVGEVDFCLKVRERGYRIAALAEAKWTYCRYDRPDSEEEREHDENLFRIMWDGVLTRGDEYYNPNFSRNKEEYSLGDNNILYDESEHYKEEQHI